MEKIRRVSVFVDGENLHHRLKDIGIKGGQGFGYKQLIDYLIKGNTPQVRRDFYAGSVSLKNGSPQASRIRSTQQKLFNFLSSKDQGFGVHLGSLIEINGVFHEKGVDVQLAVDMVVGAYEDTYDEVLLISSDRDLLPAVRQVKKLNKRVGYIGFLHKPTRALQWESTFYKLLNKQEIVHFCCA